MGKKIQEKVCINGLNILCVHGSPRSQMEKLGQEIEKNKLREAIGGISEKIILCGHSHVPSIVEVDGSIIINPGSVGIPYDGDSRAAYAIVDIINGDCTVHLKRVKYDLDNIILSAKTKSFPNFNSYEETIVKGIYVE